MREIDRLTSEQYSTPSLLLMEAAAASAVRAIAARCSHDLAGRHALILCGRGNNGGDGAAVARALWRLGAQVRVALLGRVEEAKGDARINFEIVRRLAEPAKGMTPAALSFKECDSAEDWEMVIQDRARADLVVDALLGTGVTRPVEGLYGAAVDHLLRLRAERDRANESGPLIVSLDLPSGLDADAAEPIGACVRADLTITFTAPKPANVLPPAAHFNGELIIADIGSPPTLLDATDSKLFLTEANDARAWLAATRYAPDSYKNTHGHALIIAGSRHLTGAAALTAAAAMRAGAGLVTLAAPASALASITARLMPEVMTAALAETDDGAISEAALDQAQRLAGRATVIALGPGMTSSDESTRRFVRALVEQRTAPTIIDADGLNALAPWPASLRGARARPLVLTPHPGEMLRLMGTDDRAALADRVGAARAFATAHQVVLVLKGERTLIADPDGRVFINPTGNAGLGTAGAGDTLTGLITGFCAQAFGSLKERADVVQATLAAVYAGGLAGDLAARSFGMRAMVASDVREHFSAALRALDPGGEQP